VVCATQSLLALRVLLGSTALDLQLFLAPEETTVFLDLLL
jgi:hypothetical protein